MLTSKHKKGSDDYLIDMTDYIIGDLVREKEHLYKAYNYYNGKRDKYQYENLEKNYGIKNTTDLTKEQYIAILNKCNTMPDKK